MFGARDRSITTTFHHQKEATMADTKDTETGPKANESEEERRGRLALDHAEANVVVAKDNKEKAAETPVLPKIIGGGKPRVSGSAATVLGTVTGRRPARSPNVVLLGAAAETTSVVTEAPPASSSVDVDFDDGDEKGGGGSDEPEERREDSAKPEEDEDAVAAAASEAARQSELTRREARGAETIRGRRARQNQPDTQTSSSVVTDAAAAGAAAAAAAEQRRLRDEEATRRAAAEAAAEERRRGEEEAAQALAAQRAREATERYDSWMAETGGPAIPPPPRAAAFDPSRASTPVTTLPPPPRSRSYSSPILSAVIALIVGLAAGYAIWGNASPPSTTEEATTMSAPKVSASPPAASASASAQPSAHPSGQASVPPPKEEPISDSDVADVVRESGGKWSGSKTCFIVPRETTGRHKYTVDAWKAIPGKPYVDCGGKATEPGTKNPDGTSCKDGGRNITMCKVRRPDV